MERHRAATAAKGINPLDNIVRSRLVIFVSGECRNVHVQAHTKKKEIKRERQVKTP